MTWPRGFAVLAGVLASVVLSAAAAAPQDLATAEEEAFAALSRAVSSLDGAADRSASFRTAEQLTEAVDRARDAFAAAEDARRAAADGYRGAYRAALAAAVTCANGYPCTSNRLDPFEGLTGALITHLHLLASVSFAAAVHVEAVGVAGADEARARGARIRRLAARLRDVEAGEALDRWNGLVGGLLDDTEATSALHRTSTAAHAAARRSRSDAANRVLAAIAASRGRASDAALGALLDAAQTRVEALRSSLTEAGRATSRAAVVPVTGAGGASGEAEVRAPAPAQPARLVRPAAAEPVPAEARGAAALAALDRAFGTASPAPVVPAAARPVRPAAVEPVPAEARGAAALAALNRAFGTAAGPAVPEPETPAAAAETPEPEAEAAPEAPEPEPAVEAEPPGAAAERGVAGGAAEPAPTDLVAWVRAVNAAVRRAEAAAVEAEAAAAASGSWFSRTAACVDARDRLSSAEDRVAELTTGDARPSFVTPAAGADAFAAVEERLAAARARARVACDSIEQPR